MVGRDIKRILLDFDNDFIVFEYTDRGNLFRYQEIDKLGVINTFPITDAEVYMALCKAGMFGIELLKEELVIYKPGSLPDKGEKMILQEKKRFFCPGLSESREKFLEILGYLES